MHCLADNRFWQRTHERTVSLVLGLGRSNLAFASLTLKADLHLSNTSCVRLAHHGSADWRSTPCAN